MSRRNDRFINDDSPARRREARAQQTRIDVQDEIRRLQREEYERAKAQDGERVREYLESKAQGGDEVSTNPLDYSKFLAPGGVVPDSRLGINRKKHPGIQGRPPWA